MPGKIGGAQPVCTLVEFPNGLVQNSDTGFPKTLSKKEGKKKTIKLVLSLSLGGNGL